MPCQESLLSLPLLKLRPIPCHILRIDTAYCQTLIPLHHVFYMRTVISAVVGNIIFLVVVVIDIFELRIVCAQPVPATCFAANSAKRPGGCKRS